MLLKTDVSKLSGLPKYQDNKSFNAEVCWAALLLAVIKIDSKICGSLTSYETKKNSVGVCLCNLKPLDQICSVCFGTGKGPSPFRAEKTYVLPLCFGALMLQDPMFGRVLCVLMLRSPCFTVLSELWYWTSLVFQCVHCFGNVLERETTPQKRCSHLQESEKLTDKEIWKKTCSATDSALLYLNEMEICISSRKWSCESFTMSL